jgi:2-oxoglutarate dehydrogenase E2 component (dihydrolipoamide succinyltransferase)
MTVLTFCRNLDQSVTSPCVHHRHVLRGIRTSGSLNEEVKVVTCPAFAESITEGDLKWEKAVGDSIAVDEIMCEVETDKTSVPVPSPVAGRIEELLVEDGATVTPGQDLVKILVGAAGAAKEEKAAAPAAAPTPAPAAPAASPIPTTPPETPPTPAKPSSTTQASSIPPRAPPAPAPTGARGAEPIVKLPPADPTKEIVGTRSEFRVKMNRMRQKIAARLKEAQNSTAMLTTFNEIDMRYQKGFLFS